ncbi:TetR/AcrR family transcriptional regulator [Sphingobacterium bovistauri]|uniref:TetR/AcrR family transcriptional regulator n=1 Tax=Sphingobacterium bovistauri TaxID=2781959 RepID=A0ABS7Z838_9SPHI|nr:TetR/AcrR family transcriptional regulator [Sphingobacterium bovistauri]MCA5006360.1 TetR/AcrR family transcriptional regulator [Sphingobacterium bovistauri]
MDKRKEEIIEIAIRRFSHYGFAKTTMNEIADDLKITKANLYYYYPEKIGLIKDVIAYISQDLIVDEERLVSGYNGDFLGTMFALLSFRADHMRKYYMLYINENLDWIKDHQFTEFIDEIECKDLSVLQTLLHKAVDEGTLKLSNIEESTYVLRNIIKGLGLIHTIRDVICGIPNKENIDKILDSQISAIKLIFEERIVTNK